MTQGAPLRCAGGRGIDFWGLRSGSYWSVIDSALSRCFEVGLIPALSLWSLRGWVKIFRRVDSGPPLAAGVFPLDVENPNPGGVPEDEPEAEFSPP